MATFVGAASGEGGGVSNFSVAVPPAAQAGDLLLSVAVNTQTSQPATTPPGFTAAFSGAAAGSHTTVAYRIRQAGDPTSYSYSTGGGITGTDGGTAGITVYRGVNPTSPLDKIATRDASAPAALALSPSQPDSLYISVVAVDNTTTQVDAPSPLVERYDVGSGALAAHSVSDLASVSVAQPERAYTGFPGSPALSVSLIFRPPNRPPNQPILVSPANGQSFRHNATFRFVWQHSDPDGNGQLSRTIRFRPIGTTLWINRTASSAAPFADFPAGEFGNGTTQPQWEWQVQTTDTSGATGPFSGSRTFTVAANRPPAAPILLSPTGNQSINKDAANRFSWQHVDPDGDGQRRRTMRYRQVGSATWIVTAADTPNQYLDIPAGTLAVASYEWQVATEDTFGAVGVFSSSGFFNGVAAPPGPAITAPVNGTTIGTSVATAEWTGTGTSWELRTVAEVNGAAPANPTAEQIYYHSGEQQVASAGRTWDFPLPVNSRRERLQIREKASGLFGPWSEVGYQVSYTLPAAPVGTVQASAFALRVTADNPTPSGGQPQVVYNELERARVLPDGTLAVEGFLRAVGAPGRQRLQVPIRSSYDDALVASGVEYAYRLHAVAVNGTRASGAWLITVPPVGPADPTDPTDPVDLTDPVEPTVSESV